MTPPTPPNNAFIRAEPTDNDFEILVTWADFPNEEGYQLLSNTDSSPGPIFTSGENPRPTNGWELVTYLPRDENEFIHGTIFARTYAICGYGGFGGRETTCVFPSNYAIPTYPPVPAEIESLEISQIGTDRLGVQWTQSPDTVYSRAEISPGNGRPPVENEPEQIVLFTGLQPNLDYEITVCIRNADQTAEDETCKSVSGRTWPLKPLALTNISVDQDDPNPRERTIIFSYDNQRAHQVIGFSVRLIKDNRVVKQDYVFTDSLGQHEHRYRFNELQPFTSYEAWVAPYNRSGVGAANGVGFTTPTEVKLDVEPLSGDSVMLHWNAHVAGRYSIEHKNGNTWNEIHTMQLLQPGMQRVVVEAMDGPAELRVKWKFAFLNTLSNSVNTTPLPAGTPELLSIRRTPVFLSRLHRFGTRSVIGFRTTVAGKAEYLLQHKTPLKWITVASTGFHPLTSFAANATLTLAHETTRPEPQYRVCKRQLSLNPLGWTSLCGPSDEWASKELVRVRIPSPQE